MALDDYGGTYRYAGGASQRRAIEQEVDDATEDLNMLLRPIARRKINESVAPASSLRIRIDGDRLSVTRAQGPDFSGTANRGTFDVDGKYTGRFKWRNDTLTVLITGGDQKTTIRYALDDAQERIVIRTTIEHEMLPRPVRVKSTYRRE